MGAFFLGGGGNSLEQRTHKLGASRNMGPFFLEEDNSLEQRSRKLGASRHMGAFFSGNKQP